MLTLLEPLSPASSAHPREDEVSPLDPSHAVSQLSDALSVNPSPEAPPEENLGTAVSTQGHSIFKKLLQKKGNKGSASHKLGLGQLPGKLPRAADHQSPSPSSVRVDDTNKGPSWMAAG